MKPVDLLTLISSSKVSVSSKRRRLSVSSPRGRSRDQVPRALCTPRGNHTTCFQRSQIKTWRYFFSFIRRCPALIVYCSGERHHYSDSWFALILLLYKKKIKYLSRKILRCIIRWEYKNLWKHKI